MSFDGGPTLIGAIPGPSEMGGLHVIFGSEDLGNRVLLRADNNFGSSRESLIVVTCVIQGCKEDLEFSDTP